MCAGENCVGLSWEHRLRTAIDAAQGSLVFFPQLCGVEVFFMSNFFSLIELELEFEL